MADRIHLRCGMQYPYKTIPILIPAEVEFKANAFFRNFKKENMCNED